jgi:hypothetical protein
MADCDCGRPLGLYAQNTGNKECIVCFLVRMGVKRDSGSSTSK